MYHIFHPHISDAAICLDKGDIERAKKIVSKMIDNNDNVLGEIGQLKFKVKRLHYFLEQARDTKDAEEMGEYLAEASIELTKLIKLIHKVLNEEVKSK